MIHPDIRKEVERVAKILSTAHLDVGMLHRIESDLLPDGYNGVMNVVIDGDLISFVKDTDT